MTKEQLDSIQLCKFISSASTPNSQKRESRQPNNHKQPKQPKQPKSHKVGLKNEPDTSRAKSRKIRVYVFYDFLKKTFPHFFENSNNNNNDSNTSKTTGTGICSIHKTIVLDVAGGKGDLSFLLSNLHPNIQSIIVDPRSFHHGGNKNDINTRNMMMYERTKTSTSAHNHRSIIKTIEYFENNPEKIQERNQIGTMSYQPLAVLFPMLIQQREERRKERYGRRRKTMQLKVSSVPEEERTYRNNNKNSKEEEDEEECEWIIPQCMKIYFDDNLVQTIKKLQHHPSLYPQQHDNNHDCTDTDHNYNTSYQMNIWLQYWNKANKFKINGTKTETETEQFVSQSQSISQHNQIIQSGQNALQYISKSNLIVGFHPDQATEAIIDLALLLQISFCIVPCCVFPKEFPDRRIDRTSIVVDDGVDNNDDEVIVEKVRDYNTFIEYLKNKDKRIRVDELEFQYTETARKIVLYMLSEDFL